MSNKRETLSPDEHMQLGAFRTSARCMAEVVERAIRSELLPHVSAYVKEEVSAALRPILAMLVRLPDDEKWPVPDRASVAIGELDRQTRELKFAVDKAFELSPHDIANDLKDRLVWLDRALNRLDKASAGLDEAVAKINADKPADVVKELS